MRLRPVVLLPAAVLLAVGCRGPFPLDTRTFELHYLHPSDAEHLVNPYIYFDRPGAKGAISISTGSITVRETRDNLDKIARVLAQYDHARPNVRLTFQLIEADGFAHRDPAIADVEATLRTLFRFTGYRLVAQGVATSLEGGTITQELGGASAPYGLLAEIRHVVGSGDSATVELQVRLRLPRGGDFGTIVSLPIGKTAVLGNVQSAPGATTLILTVRPERTGG